MSEVILWEGKTIQQYMSEMLYTKRMRDCDGRVNARHYVYRLFDKDSRLIYVGCSYDPESRINHHRRGIWWYEQIPAASGGREAPGNVPAQWAL